LRDHHEIKDNVCPESMSSHVEVALILDMAKIIHSLHHY
jgi:hypothetical protein